MKDSISKSASWAKDVWSQAVPSWEERKQDHNYRDILARPGIHSALAALNPIHSGTFLDIGCAEGAETFYIRELLEEMGWSGKMFAHDLQSSFIGVAKSVNKANSKIPIQFGNHSLEGFIKDQQLNKKVDLVTSIFVLQDLPDIQEHLGSINNVLNEKGSAVFITVHPHFGQAMKDKGAVRIAQHLDKKDGSWDWASEYPIVEENGQTFFVPYFQRTVDQYTQYLKKYFSQIELVSLQPSAQQVEDCRNEKRSPFYMHEGNIYYPEIVEMESSLVIIAKR